MIIVPQSFVLSAPVPLTNPRILWKNLLAGLPASSVTVSGETDTGPRDAPTRPNTDEYWEPPSLPAWAIFDMGQAYDINGIGLAAHNFGTKQTTVKVEAGLDPSFAVDATFGAELTPANDAAILLLDETRLARYVRIALSGVALPRLAVASVGEVLAMPKAVSGPYRPITMARRTTMSGRKSRGGQFLGQNMRAHGLESTAAFRNLDGPWVRSHFDPFSRHARSLPYFFAWNPLELPLEVAYVWQPEGEEDIVPEHNGNGLDMDVSWRMFGLGHE